MRSISLKIDDLIFGEIENIVALMKKPRNRYINEAIDYDNEIIISIEDWKFEERLSREFEAIGFFISDHPLNQFKEIFDDYNIIDYIYLKKYLISNNYYKRGVL